MPHVNPQHALEMAAAQDQDPVEAVGADGADPALRVGIRVRRPNRRADHFHSLGTEHLVEPAAELRVAIVDQKPERLLLAELHHQVARLLRCPAAVGVRGTGHVLDPSRRQRNEEQHVDPLQKGGLNGEKVAGQRCRRLLTQERSPRQPRSLRSRRQGPASISTLRTVVGETTTPRPLSSPTIRRYPQCGFSLARRRINAPTGGSSGGLPRFVCGYVQRRATSWRCQRSSVSGLTGKLGHVERGSERLKAARNARSARVSLGRADCRRRTASSWRSARISNSFDRRDCPNSHTSANRFRTTRYTNDQSNQPSLGQDQSAEPTELDALESRGRVCEPYGLPPPARR